MSGIVSAPSRIPIPSTGIPAAISTGTITRIDPPGIPGTENEVTTEVSAMVSSSAAPRSTPYSRAMKSTPTVCPIPAPARNIVAASGIRTFPIVGGSRSRSRTASSIAGNAASDERELKAIVCAGSAARANSRSDVRPRTTAAGYNTPPMKTTQIAETTPM